MGMEIMEIVSIDFKGEGYYNSDNEIGKRDKDTNEYGWFSKDCKLLGIPLTEEWLVKMGIVQNERTTIWNYKEVWFWWDGIELISVITCTNLSHVHSVQNFIYALTGEELIFTP